MWKLHNLSAVACRRIHDRTMNMTRTVQDFFFFQNEGATCHQNQFVTWLIVQGGDENHLKRKYFRIVRRIMLLLIFLRVNVNLVDD